MATAISICVSVQQMPYVKPKNQECPRCSKRFTTNRDLSSHIHRKKPCEPIKAPIPLSSLYCATHPEPPLRTCPSCVREFSRQALRDHLLNGRCVARGRWQWHLGDVSTFTAMTRSFPSFQQWQLVWNAELFAFIFEHDRGDTTVMLIDMLMVAHNSEIKSAITINTNTALMVHAKQAPPFRQAVVQRTVTPQPAELVRERLRVTNEQCVEAIQSASDLTDESKAQYIGCLKRLVFGGTGRNGLQPTSALIPNSSLLWCAIHPEQTCKLLQTSLQSVGLLNPRNIHNYTAPLRSVLAHHPHLSKLRTIRERWTKAAESLCVNPIAAEAKTNRPSERQKQGFVIYQEIAAKFTELCEKDLGSKESLLVGLVGLGEEKLMPQRRDYGLVKLCIGRQPSSEEAKGNYLVVKQDSNGQFAGSIALNHYKTSKTYGEQRVQLPLPYIRTLLASLQRDPRDWLFTKRPDKNTPENKPYESANSFGKFANRTLEKVFGKPLTLTGCRHSFITQLHCSTYWGSLSDAQREQIAKQMGHNYTTACRYRFVDHSA